MDKISNYEQLVEYLKENSDVKFNEFNSKIVNSDVKTIGCTVPFVRKLAKSLSFDFVMSLPVNRYVEVDLLRGIALSNAKIPFESKSVMLLNFAQTIENWAVCDCSVVKPNIAEKELYFKFFLSLLSAEKEFVCRYGIVNLLSGYLDNEHIEEIFAEFDNIKLRGKYYVDMACAWLIATAMAKCRKQTIKYMENGARKTLNKFTYNRTLQKMRDSYRISAEDKQWTYSQKID